jgi:pimeloyl-ACP methyl ester carboxylesterase
LTAPALEATAPGRQLTRRQVGQALAAVAGAGLPFPTNAQPAKPTTPGGHADAPWLTLPPTPALPTPSRSDVATVNGTKIYFAQFGDGEPVLLLHGGMGNSNYWGHQIPELAKRFSVIAMDTRGHGRSPVTSAAFGYRLFAEDVTALLDHLDIPKASLVGWSDGAITGLQLAMTRPEKVARLFAFGANSTLDGLKPNGARSPVFVAYAQRCRAEYRTLSPHPEKWPQLVDGLRAMWRSQPSFSKEKLAGIKAPTAVSVGEYDEIIKREHTEAMARQIRGARLVMLPRVSHFAMLQNAARFNDALLAFLKG